MSESYRDRWIECGADGLRISGYYFPWGTKHISYGEIRGIRRVALSTVAGKARLWGTANPRYWLHLDPRRPKKCFGFVLDLGGRVQPIITPDDPDAMEEILRRKTGIPAGSDPVRRAPLV